MTKKEKEDMIKHQEHINMTYLSLVEKCYRKFPAIMNDEGQFDTVMQESLEMLYKATFFTWDELHKMLEMQAEAEFKYREYYKIETDDDQNLFSCMCSYYVFSKQIDDYIENENLWKFKILRKALSEKRKLYKEIIKPIEEELGISLPYVNKWPKKDKNN